MARGAKDGAPPCAVNPSRLERNILINPAHPDSTAEPNAKGNVVWQCVDVVADKPFKKPVTLEQIKLDPKLSEMSLIKYSRLSVQPVTDAEWDHILKLGGL